MTQAFAATGREYCKNISATQYTLRFNVHFSLLAACLAASLRADSLDVIDIFT